MIDDRYLDHSKDSHPAQHVQLHPAPSHTPSDLSITFSFSPSQQPKEREIAPHSHSPSIRPVTRMARMTRSWSCALSAPSAVRPHILILGLLSLEQRHGDGLGGIRYRAFAVKSGKNGRSKGCKWMDLMCPSPSVGRGGLGQTIWPARVRAGRPLDYRKARPRWSVLVGV
jgi:hypothetical protein